MTTGVSFLSPEFLKSYEEITPRHKGTLFEVQYLKTYSHFIVEKGRREKWNEIIERVVNYNIGLYQGPASYDSLCKEAEFMYDQLFHLYTYPAGRTLWVGGRESVEKWPESAFNCATLVLDELEDFCDLLHLLLVGAGVGFRVLREDVSKFPSLNTKFSVVHESYNSLPKEQRLELTEVEDVFDLRDICIGDSKEGWIQALRAFLEGCRDGVPVFKFNYDSIRPKGERIKTFGGRAPGYEGLKDMFIKLEEVIKESNGVISSTVALDMSNIIAQNVLIGGTRRSAEIALGSSDDLEFINAKFDLHEKPKKEYRRKSNNSVVYFSKPTKDELRSVLERIRNSWEPGMLNFEAASKKRPWFAAVNPCGEYLGADRGLCNLSGIVLTSFVNKNETGFDIGALEKGIRLAVRIGLRQTNVSISLPKWDFVQKRDRMIGPSIIGLMDALDTVGWEFDSTQAINLYKLLNYWANDEADIYSFEMRIPRPLLVCLIKPEGSIRLLPTASAGLHRERAPYYIRRMRILNIDPLCAALKSLGVTNEPVIGEEGIKTVFSFAIKSKTKLAADAEPAIRQLERYLILMKHYVDHNASCTLSIGDLEWEAMKDRVYDEWENIVAVAFQNKNLLENKVYKQLPEEAMSEEQYNVFPKPDLTNLGEVLARFEVQNEEYDIIEDSCASGVCPTR